jgi:hypothetical protein
MPKNGYGGLPPTSKRTKILLDPLNYIKIPKKWVLYQKRPAKSSYAVHRGVDNVICGLLLVLCVLMQDALIKEEGLQARKEGLFKFHASTLKLC